MASPYKRRRPSLVRNFWVYRRLIALAMVLGLMLWFIWANGTAVTVAFPFGMGRLTSTLGLVILASALVGAVASALVFTMFFAVRRIHASNIKNGTDPAPELPEDRPPPDYASKTSEGIDQGRWS